MVRLRDLERHLRAHGCYKEREGGRHTIWRGPSGSLASVPRHRQIPHATAARICNDLDIARI